MNESRVIRVFVSSTFHDMQADRDALVLRIFPQLRRLFHGRQLSVREPAGAEVLVAGSAVFGGGQARENARRLREAASTATA